MTGHSLEWRRGILVRVLRTPVNRLDSFNLCSQPSFPLIHSVLFSVVCNVLFLVILFILRV